MLRSAPAASLARSSFRSVPRSSRHPSRFVFANVDRQFYTRVQSFKRPLALALIPHSPISTALQRYASTDHIDKDREAKLGGAVIEQHPDMVSIDSTVRHVTHEEGVEEPEPDTDMLAGVKSDLVWATSV